MRATRSSERIEFRTTPDNKALLERAAALQGTTVTEFVETEAVKAAQATIQEEVTLRLSNRDREIFLAMLEADMETHPALLQGFRDVK